MLGKMRWPVVVAVLATGCATPMRRIGVRGNEVVAHLVELNQSAVAEMQTTIEVTAGRMEGERENVFLNQSVVFRGTQTTVDKLIAGCVPKWPTTCALIEHGDELVVLRTLAEPVEPRRGDHDASASTVFGAVTVGAATAAGICLGVCDSHKDTLVGAAVGTALVSGLLWLLSTGRD